MNKKNIINISAILFFLLILNSAGEKLYKRFDITADQRYTLSEMTSDLVSTIKDPLIINVYLEGEFPAEFKRLQIETRQFLDELKSLNKNIHFQFINPDNSREKLIKKGMIPSQLTNQDEGKITETIIFPWAEISYRNKRENVSLLSNKIFKNQESKLQDAVEKLEYSFAIHISSLLKSKKPSIAVLSGNGELDDLYLYSFLSTIKNKYKLAKFTLDSVQKKPKETLNDLKSYDLALIAKPTQRFTEKEKFVLDQYIANGGKSIWMIDNNFSDTDSLYNEGKMMAFPRDLNLTDLLFNYQIRINNKLIQDLYSAKIPLATGNIGKQTQFQHLNWFYNPLVNGNPNHSITKNISPVKFEFATQIDILKGDIKKTPLLVSSGLTKKIGTPTFIELNSIAEKPKQNEYKAGPQIFAILLEGKFPSAYKNRTKPFNTTDNFIEESTDNKMIVISDGDIAKNQILKGKPHDLEMDKWTGAIYGNKEFLLNSVDYLLNESELISLRNKTLRINLIDKKKAFNEKRNWQLLNIIMPITLLIIFALAFNYLRKRRYSKI